jgi:hypothetical protein
MNYSNESWLIWFHVSVGSCISTFLAASKLFAASLPKKWVWHLYRVSSFGKQHINLVNPILEYISFFITGGLTSAWKRRFNLHLMNTEDQLFSHSSLSANIFSTLDAGPSCRTQNARINDDCCDKQQSRGSLAQWIKISLKCPNVFLCFARGELDYSVGSTQGNHWIFLLDSPSNPSQSRFSQILCKTSF